MSTSKVKYQFSKLRNNSLSLIGDNFTPIGGLKIPI